MFLWAPTCHLFPQMAARANPFEVDAADESVIVEGVLMPAWPSAVRCAPSASLSANDPGLTMALRPVSAGNSSRRERTLAARAPGSPPTPALTMYTLRRMRSESSPLTVRSRPPKNETRTLAWLAMAMASSTSEVAVSTRASRKVCKRPEKAVARNSALGGCMSSGAGSAASSRARYSATSARKLSPSKPRALARCKQC